VSDRNMGACSAPCVEGIEPEVIPNTRGEAGRGACVGSYPRCAHVVSVGFSPRFFCARDAGGQRHGA